MKIVNIHDIKAKLSEYLDFVQSGEIVTICRRNLPIAELRGLAIPKQLKKRELGLFKGEIQIMPEFFNDLDSEFLDFFEGSF